VFVNEIKRGTRFIDETKRRVNLEMFVFIQFQNNEE
jgi:hypothetical protein